MGFQQSRNAANAGAAAQHSVNNVTEMNKRNRKTSASNGILQAKSPVFEQVTQDTHV